jgi:hypothetical protein
VVRQNLPETPDFLRLADELGVHSVYLRSLIPSNYALTFPDSEVFKAYPAWSHPEVAYWQDRAREAIEKVKVQVFGDLDQWSVPLHRAEVRPRVDRTEWVASVVQEPPLIRTKGDPLPAGSTHDDCRRPATNPYGSPAPRRSGVLRVTPRERAFASARPLATDSIFGDRDRVDLNQQLWPEQLFHNHQRAGRRMRLIHVGVADIADDLEIAGVEQVKV